MYRLFSLYIVSVLLASVLESRNTTLAKLSHPELMWSSEEYLHGFRFFFSKRFLLCFE